MEGIGIRVEGLSKRLRGKQALSSLSMEFNPATLHGIIGPDGAGKTTLIRMLAGLLHPDTGSIIWETGGETVPFSSVRPDLAYMPQQQSLYADLSVSEHLDFFRDLYRISPEIYAERRERLLHLTRLAPFAGRPAGKLSGGMYKKLGLMCALLQSPRVVLLDEPTNGVDPISRREFWEMLYGLVDGGILVLVSTAYMDEAERCGKVHIMEEGRLLASGEPRDILKAEGVRNFEELFLGKAGTPS